MNYIDLHLHSNISADGDFSPGDLMRRCRDAGLKIVALADHNSLSGVEEAKSAAGELGLICVSAVELDCDFQGTNLHLLGYHVVDRYGWFAGNDRELKRQDRVASQKRVEAIRSLGIALEDEKLESLSFHGIITGEMIAEAALNDSRNEGMTLLDPYRSGGNRSQNPFVNFYWDFCSQGKIAFVPIRFPDLSEAIEEIKRAGGVPILAHPGANIGRNEDLFRRIISQGVLGVEVFSSYHDHETSSFYKDLARKMNLRMTLGSDFHGRTKPAICLGKIDCDCQNEIAEWISGLL